MKVYTGKDPYLFLSYSHADRDVVVKLLKELKRRMCRVWYDEGLTGGDSWNDLLAERILEAKEVMVLLTESSVKSPYVRAEINYAISKGKKVIPVFLGEVTLPAGLEFVLSEMHQLRFSDKSLKPEHTREIMAQISREVFASKNSPFYETNSHSFYLKEYALPHNSEYMKDEDITAMSIICKYNDGKEKEMFKFEPAPILECKYSVSQIYELKDDYFSNSDVENVKILSVFVSSIIRPCLNFTDLDAVMIFVLRTPEEYGYGEPTITLIDYKDVTEYEEGERRGGPLLAEMQRLLPKNQVDEK